MFVIDRLHDRNDLLMKETFMIETHKPSLYTGLRTSKELQRFKIHFFFILLKTYC